MTIAELDLVTVAVDGETDLISLAIGDVLATDIRFAPDGTPHLDMTAEIEDAIWKAAGMGDHTSEDDGCPGWELVVPWIKANRHLLG